MASETHSTKAGKEQFGSSGDPIDRVDPGRRLKPRQQGATKQDRRPARRQRRVQPAHQRSKIEPVGIAEGGGRKTEIPGFQRSNTVDGSSSAFGDGEVIYWARRPELLQILGRGILGFRKR